MNDDKRLEFIRSLYQKYNLYYDAGNPDSKSNDIFIHKHYVLITRTGIDKIRAAEGIVITYEPVFMSDQTVVFKARGFRKTNPEVVVETFASANAATCHSGYYAEVAEKRANSRVVLKLVGLYSDGVYGADEFDSLPNDERRAVYKGK